MILRIYLIILIICSSYSIGQNYRSLFNGKDLTGWHLVTGEDTSWRAENGLLVGRHNGTSAYDQLGSDSIYDNFTLRFKYKSIVGNSGFFFRGEEVGASGMSGHQVLTTQVNEAGGLWETHGRNWIIAPNDRGKSFYIPDDWNQWEIHAYNRHLTLYLNDSLIGDLPNDPGRLEGIFAVKMHGGGGYIEVHIKDIEMADTTRSGCMDSTALNYDPFAFKDDGKCEPVFILEPFKITVASPKIIIQDAQLKIQSTFSLPYNITLSNISGVAFFNKQVNSKGPLIFDVSTMKPKIIIITILKNSFIYSKRVINK